MERGLAPKLKQLFSKCNFKQVGRNKKSPDVWRQPLRIWAILSGSSVGGEDRTVDVCWSSGAETLICRLNNRRRILLLWRMFESIKLRHQEWAICYLILRLQEQAERWHFNFSSALSMCWKSFRWHCWGWAIHGCFVQRRLLRFGPVFFVYFCATTILVFFVWFSEKPLRGTCSKHTAVSDIPPGNSDDDKWMRSSVNLSLPSLGSMF